MPVTWDIHSPSSGSDRQQPSRGLSVPAQSGSWQKNLYALTLAQFIIFVAFGFIYPFQPLFVRDLGITDLHAVELWSGVISFGQALVLSIFSPIWGAIADRRGRRLMVLRVAFGGGLVFALMALSQNVYEFLGLRLVQGALTGVIAAGTALAASFVPRERLGYALGMLQMSLLAGNAVGPLIGGAIADALGFRASFLVTGILMWLAGLVTLFFVKEQFVPPGRQDGGKGPFATILQSVRSAGSDRQLMMMMLVLFSVQFGTNTVVPILPLVVQSMDVKDSAATVTGVLFMVTGVVSSITVVLLGRLSDRFGYRRLLIVMAIGAGLFYIPQGLVTSVIQLIVLRGLLGFFDGGIIPTANALVGSSSASHERGTIYGLIYAATGLGFAFGPLCGGILAASLGLRSVFLFTAFILLAIGLYLPFGLREPRGPDGSAAAAVGSGSG